jgi:hypothetical protein
VLGNDINTQKKLQSGPTVFGFTTVTKGKPTRLSTFKVLVEDYFSSAAIIVFWFSLLPKPYDSALPLMVFCGSFFVLRSAQDIDIQRFDVSAPIFHHAVSYLFLLYLTVVPIVAVAVLRKFWGLFT